MKSTTLLLTGLLAMLSMMPTAQAGSEGGNGGAGTSVNGIVRTFFESGYYKDASIGSGSGSGAPVPLSDVPGAVALTQFLQKANYLTDQGKEKLTHLIPPQVDHIYYKVSETQFSPVVMAKLLERYSKVMKTPVSKLKLFAITDPSTKSTYLLPKFFGLSRAGQAAILFHEELWLLEADGELRSDACGGSSSRLTYDKVIEAEMAIEAAIADTNSKNDQEHVTRVSRLVNDLRNLPTPRGEEPLVSKQNWTAFLVLSDFLSARLDGAFNGSGAVSLDKFMGRNYVLSNSGPAYTIQDGNYALYQHGDKTSAQAFDTNTRYLAMLHPKSQFLRMLTARPRGQSAYDGIFFSTLLMRNGVRASDCSVRILDVGGVVLLGDGHIETAFPFSCGYGLDRVNGILAFDLEPGRGK